MHPLLLSRPENPLQLWGGVECTHNRIGSEFHSQLARSGHWTRLEDLDRIAALGIRTLRFPLVWEDLVPEWPNKIDWAWADRRMDRIRELGIRPIVGLVHHGSGPRVTSLVDPQFPEKLSQYAAVVAERYPWVDAWTPVNEPLTTARFAGLYGHWFPHGRDQRTFCRVLMVQLRAVALSMRAVRAVNPAALLVQTEDLGEITACPSLQYQADFENERRWLSFDLLAGSLKPGGALWSYLREGAVGEHELVSFVEEPCPPNLLGLNHYVTSDRYLRAEGDRNVAALHEGNGRDAYVDLEAVRASPDGFCEPERLLEAAWERYGVPIAITEAHLGCTREEQMRWFMEMWGGALKAREAGVPVVAVTAWSLLGAYDWNSLLTRVDGSYEPGAWDMRSPEPRPTALATMLQEIAKTGRASHPVLAGAGWWRRRVRRLRAPEANCEEDPRDLVRKVYLPQSNHSVACVRPLLISGATGQLGQALARLCYLRGLAFRLLTRLEMDIADASSVRSAVRTFQPWAIINAAGFQQVDRAELEHQRCFRENAMGPTVLALACRDSNIPLLTFSSDLVFDGSRSTPYVEKDPPTTFSVYGKSKAEGEKRVLEIHYDALIVRSGPQLNPWGTKDFLGPGVEGDVLKRGADRIYLSPTYTPDLIHAALDLLIDGERGIWHLANTGAPSLQELCDECIHLGFPVPLSRPVGVPQATKSGASSNCRLLGSQRGVLLPHWRDALLRYSNERQRTSSPQSSAFASTV